MVDTTKPSEKPFTVLKIDEMTRLSDISGVERYYRHRIKTKGGVVLTIDIDEANFTDEKARPIFDYLKLRQDFENTFPGYESDIHGVERFERNGKKYFKTICIKKD